MSSETNPALRETFRNLSAALRNVHKALLDMESRRFGAVGNPFEHLQLVTSHPQFAWLRVLSEFIVELDERQDDPLPFSEAEVNAFKNSLEQLIGPSQEPLGEFRQRYLESLHESPEIVMAHAALRRIVGELPASDDTHK